MKANFNIEPTLLENRGAFNDEFYNRFKLRPNDRPLQLNESISKNYLFPTFYGDVTCAIGIFFCNYQKAQDLMPTSKLKPISMGRGRSLVVFSHYIYRNILGVMPYNEIAMTIPVLFDPAVNVPILPMVLPFFKNFGYYCFSMPVTSLENQIRGEKIWGLPKVVQEINFNENDDSCQVEAKESSGEVYYQMTIPKKGKAIHFDVGTSLYSKRGNDFLQSSTFFKGTFNVTKNMGSLLRRPSVPDREYLKIGQSASGQVLKKLQIEPRPFQLRYASQMSSCFDLPNPHFKPNIQF